ncbi:hypothetical protein ACXR2T_08175 [Leucobacter sp. HY1910]
MFTVDALKTILADYGPMTEDELFKASRKSWPRTVGDVLTMIRESRVAGLGYAGGRWALASQIPEISQAISSDRLTADAERLQKNLSQRPLDEPLTGAYAISGIAHAILSTHGAMTSSELLQMVRDSRQSPAGDTTSVNASPVLLDGYRASMFTWAAARGFIYHDETWGLIGDLAETEEMGV